MESSAPEERNEEQSGAPDPVQDRVLEPGLYVVATPIGNLEDITLRALRVLKSVARIACEDTRQTQKLLHHFQIKTPTVSYHQHNESSRTPELIAEIRAGGRVALVSDAGMPGISDPGSQVIAAAIAAGIRVIPIPGANAAVSAVVASGLSTESFVYLGFLPSKAGERRTFLEEHAHEKATLIFYETPHRILDALKDIAEMFGPERKAVVCRELTKMHEEFLRGTAESVLAVMQQRERQRGEITLIVEGASPAGEGGGSAEISVRARVEALMLAESLDEKDALKRVARERGLSKSDAYRELQRQRGKR